MASDLQSILNLEVPIIVEIGSRQMPLEAVLALAPGAIIELTKCMDDELEIKVNNKPIGLGFAVKVGENFGLRITYVGDIEARINALSENAGSSNSDGGDSDEDLAAQMLAGQA